MDRNYDDDEFAITLSADRDFVIWWVMSVAFAVDSLVKSDDFKNRCLSAYKLAKSNPKRGEADGE